MKKRQPTVPIILKDNEVMKNLIPHYSSLMKSKTIQLPYISEIKIIQ